MGKSNVLTKLTAFAQIPKKGGFITLSTPFVESDKAISSVVGSLSVVERGSGPWIYTLIDSGSGQFALTGNDIVIAGAISHAQSPSIKVSATDGIVTIETIISIFVRQPLPKGPQSLTFASNRPGWHQGAVTATAALTAGLSHQYHVSPEWTATGLRLLFTNFFVAVSGGNNPETATGNAITVDFATVFVGGVAKPVTFGGASTAIIPDGGFVWSDPVMDGAAELSLPPRSTYYVRASMSCPIGARLPISDGSMPTSRFTNWSLGDGVEYTAAVQTGKRLTGTVGSYSNGSQTIGPSMIVAKGWSGDPVYAIMGDSIGAGQSDAGTDLTRRGVVGHIALALDDVASGRRSFANLAVPGTKPQDQASDAPGQQRLRLAALRGLPNQPFNRIVSRMGQNGIFAPFGVTFPEFGATQPQNLQNAMRKWWAFLLDQFAAPIIQLPVTPRAYNTVNTNFWVDPALTLPTDPASDTYPSGTRYQFNDWLRGAGNLPARVTVVDDDVWRDPSAPSAFRAIAGSWTINADQSAGAATTILAGAFAPVQGDWFVLEPGVAGKAELRSAYRVTGTGPWTVYFTAAPSFAHLAGSVVKAAPTGDGLHPGRSLHVAAIAPIIAAKAQMDAAV